MLKNESDNYLIEIDHSDKETWSRLLMLFDDATIYHTWSYGAALYGNNNLSHLILKKDGNVIAMAQIGIRRFPFLQSATANVHWGPLWRNKYSTPSPDSFEHIVLALKNEYGIKRHLLLRLWPNEISNHDHESKKILEKAGYIFNYKLGLYHTLRLCIKPSLEELRKNLDQKWRNQLNRAEKNNFNFIEGTDDLMFGVFLRLQKEMITRKRYIPGVDYEKFRLIQNDLPETQKMKIMICEYQGEPVCVSICSAIGDTGIYMLGATGDKGMRLNGSNLLQWRIIKWLKERGCTYYDLGGIDPESNPGVYRFKCGIAGNTGKHETLIGQFIFHASFRTYFLNMLIDKAHMIPKASSILRRVM